MIDLADVDDPTSRLVDGYLTFAADLPARLADAVATGAPLARIVHGYFSLLSHRAAGWAAAAATVEELSVRSLSPYETAHLAAVRRWVDGDLDAVADTWQAILDEFGPDWLSLRLAHFALFNQGELDRMAAMADHALATWPLDLPRRSYLAGMAAFAAEERRDLRRAEALGRDAVAVDPADLWSVHAVAHVLETEGRDDEGNAWVTARFEELVAAGSFANHLWWHQALYLLDLDDVAAVLRLWDRRIYPAASEEGLDVSNGVAMLARLAFRGVDVGDRWQRIAPACRARTGHHTHPFNDAHFALGLAMAADDGEADAFVASMQAWTDAHGATTAADVHRRCGLGLAEAGVAYARGHRTVAAAAFDAVEADLWRIGGSHAQRDLWVQLRAAVA